MGKWERKLRTIKIKCVLVRPEKYTKRIFLAQWRSSILVKNTRFDVDRSEI